MINRRFLIRKKLGQGRSAVYLCEDLEKTGKNTAIKILPANSSEEEKNVFKDEFQTIQKLDHPNIIQAYERGAVVEVSENEPIAVGSKYLVMEYFYGNEMLSYPIDDELALKEIITQICSVLFYLHQSKYIYYDLKPENILVNEVNGKPFIKLIDLGFARSYTNKNNHAITGTAEYLAPEVLKKEFHDHRVDLYSLGILLYRLIYKKFPFDSHDQLEIYKAHIEKEFIFSETKYSGELINVLKKLLNKNPEERYFNSIQILYDLKIPITEELSRDWVPIKAFSNRTDILNIVNRYVSTPSLGEIIIIKGFEKSGKSAVSGELNSRYENLILLNNDRTKTGTQLIRFFLNKLIFNDLIFHKLTAETHELADKIFNNRTENLVGDLKLVINKVTQLSRIILLLDDFNLYDNFALEVFKEIFPILQVNGCNIILTEKSDLDYVTGFINNSVELNLSSFTADQTDELLEKTYAEFFPIKEVQHLIMLYADLLPGNIIEFLNDIVLLKIIQFDHDGIKVISEENADILLRNLHEEIYNIRYKSLTAEQIEFSGLLSSFEIVPEKNDLLQLTNLTEEGFTEIVKELQYKHIFQSQSQTGLIFSSDGIRNFIYSKISDKKKHHEKIAKTIHQKIPQFNKVELARQYQICENYDESYTLLLMEAEEAEKISALKYEQNILEQILKMPLNKNQEFEVKYRLCSLYNTLNIYKNAFELVEELINREMEEDERNHLLIIKGNSLIRLGDVEKGKEILKTLLPSVKEETKKIKLMLDIAWGEFETNNYELSADIGNSVISNPLALSEYKGDSYNLLGLIDIHQKDDLNSALLNFEKCLEEYSITKLAHRIAAIEINIGNIRNILGDYEKVEKHWNTSLEISSSSGNLNYQAQVLMNFGIYHFNRQSFESAIQNYKRATLIFNTLGDKLGQGRSELNLGEVSLFICEYQNAMDSLINATEIFNKLQNYVEESESLFLLAKAYSRIGDYFNFNKIIEGMDSLFKVNIFPERTKTHLDFLNCIRRYELNSEIDSTDLFRIANTYLSQEERLNYFEAMTLLVNYHLFQGESTKAFNLLSEKDFTEICDSNIYLKIEKLYLMGKTASENSTLYPESSIFYFTEAFNLISDLNVNETTCKIILELSDYYSERGNFLKAKEYASYGRSLINFIADQFRDDRSKDIYLNSSYRKYAWEKFTEIINYN